ncbi:MAG: MFS transporter [Acidimicrobiia bacterium]|nr:MFS transporter [Acidimicrobiia bacterium]
MSEARERTDVAATVARVSWWPMAVLALVNLVDQVDMAILRGVLPILEDEWSLSDLQLGLLGFAFIFVNALATVPAGWVADHTRRNRLIGWTLVSWSALITLSATAVNYVNLLGARAVMGIGQAVDDPASTSLLGDYYPARLRARAFSLTQVALFVGGGIGLALGGFVGSTLGWRWAFALVGMPGSIVAVLAFRLREPVRGEADRALGVEPPPAPPDLSLKDFAGRARTELWAEVKVIFGIRTMRYILVGVAALLFTVSGIGYWLAVYHERYSGMSVGEATAFTAVVLGVGGGIGTILGGVLSDRLHGSIDGGRILLVVWSSIACTVLFLGSFAIGNVPVRLGMQFVGVLAAAGAVPGLRASMLDVVPAESRGVGASAFALTSSIFGSALAPPLVGLLSDLTSLVGAFYIVFPPVIVGLLFLLRARRTVEADAAALISALAPS